MSNPSRRAISIAQAPCVYCSTIVSEPSLRPSAVTARSCVERAEVHQVGVYAGRLLKVSSIASGPAAEPRSRLLSPLGKLWSRLTREDGRLEA